MEIIISGRHLPIDDTVRAYVNDKMQRLEKEYPKLTTGRVVLCLERSWCVAEVHVNGKHITLDAKAESHDAFMSIDGALEKIERQLRRYVERIQEHRGEKSAAEVVGLEAAAEPGAAPSAVEKA